MTEKTAEKQEKYIQEITATNAGATSWADIVSKEEVRKNVEDTIEKKAKRKRGRKS